MELKENGQFMDYQKKVHMDNGKEFTSSRAYITFVTNIELRISIVQ